MWSDIQSFVANLWVGIALGLVLLVLGWKMNATWANWLLVGAWLIFALTFSRVSAIASQPLIPRVLWTMLFAAAVGLLLYHALWTETAPSRQRNGQVANAPDDSLLERRQVLYAEFAALRPVRAGVYADGFVQALTIASLLGDLERLRGKKDVQALTADIGRRINLRDQWLKEKRNNDGALNGLLARIQSAFMKTSELDALLARVRMPFPDEDLAAPSDEAAARKWVQEASDAFNKSFKDDFARPLEELEAYLAKNAVTPPTR